MSSPTGLYWILSLASPNLLHFSGGGARWSVTIACPRIAVCLLYMYVCTCPRRMGLRSCKVTSQRPLCKVVFGVSSIEVFSRHEPLVVLFENRIRAVGWVVVLSIRRYSLYKHNHVISYITRFRPLNFTPVVRS